MLSGARSWVGVGSTAKVRAGASKSLRMACRLAETGRGVLPEAPVRSARAVRPAASAGVARRGPRGATGGPFGPRAPDQRGGLPTAPGS